MKEEYDWTTYPRAAGMIEGMIKELSDRSGSVKTLSEDLWRRTSTRTMDWVDHIRMETHYVDRRELTDAGFKEIESGTRERLYVHQGSTLPSIRVGDEVPGIWIKVEDIELFRKRRSLNNEIEGDRFSPVRELLVSKDGGIALGAVERRGYAGCGVPDANDQEKYGSILDRLRNRKREGNDEERIRELVSILQEGIDSIGKDRTCDAFFDSERRYWEMKNQAGRLQLDRQNLLGLGWGNHDHHTFRCSRSNFKRTISILEMIGMEPRERFYAGDQAGWGAQVMEQKECGIVVFADVDLSVEEKEGDFAHNGLDESDEAGTVGLWVGLHGESILSAGLHHLAARVSFSQMMLDAERSGIRPMAPFSDLPYLKQCFSEGERWDVKKERASQMLEKKRISSRQFEKFVKSGALGSHLEMIERRQGFKGFNRESVSDIIHRTDPRN